MQRNQGVHVCSGQLQRVLDDTETEPELGLQRHGKTLLTVNYLPFFLMSYRSNNHLLVQSSGSTMAPSLWDFPGKITEEYLEHQLFADSGQQLVVLEAQASTWLNN